jgi:hypothetical protein
MDKDIVPAFIRRDEAVTFSGVEPFYNTGEHGAVSPRLVVLHRFHLRTLFLAWLEPGTGSFFSPGVFAGVTTLGQIARHDQSKLCAATQRLEQTAALLTQDQLHCRFGKLLVKSRTFPGYATSSRLSRTRT